MLNMALPAIRKGGKPQKRVIDVVKEVVPTAGVKEEDEGKE